MDERAERELLGILAELRPAPMPAGELLAVRRALSAEVRGAGAPEVMTLPEVAEFLRIDEADLAEILDELPAFELAGRLRVRRARLVEWIEHRERTWRHAAGARTVGAATRFGKGVA
jgi:hypothetical protein